MQSQREIEHWDRLYLPNGKGWCRCKSRTGCHTLSTPLLSVITTKASLEKPNLSKNGLAIAGSESQLQTKSKTDNVPS